MAQARKKRQFPGNGGFTLSEMLAAVAVLTLLLALSLPALGELQREIRQKELDSKAEILYVAIGEDIHTLQFRPELLDRLCPDLFPELLPEESALKGIVRIYRPEKAVLYHDDQQKQTLALLSEA